MGTAALFHRLQLATYESHISGCGTLFHMFCVGSHTIFFCSANQLNSKFQTFHSSQEGVTGTRDIPSHEKSKSEQNIWNIVFQYTEDLSTVIPRWRKKKKKLTRWVSPLLQLTSLSEFPGHCAKRGKPGGVLWTLWVRKTELKIWGNQSS